MYTQCIDNVYKYASKPQTCCVSITRGLLRPSGGSKPKCDKPKCDKPMFDETNV